MSKISKDQKNRLQAMLKKHHNNILDDINQIIDMFRVPFKITLEYNDDERVSYISIDANDDTNISIHKEHSWWKEQDENGL